MATPAGRLTVSVLATATNAVVATAPVGLLPGGVAVHLAGTFVYVANLAATSSSFSTP
jgi:DNA-binding beta-propeller fold protein YncE